MEKKDSKHSSPHASKEETRQFNENGHSAECSVSYTRTKAELLHNVKEDQIPISTEHGYCFLNFYKVFFTLSAYVICKECHGDIQFFKTIPRGLGFQLTLECKCGVKFIDSCPLIDGAFEINRRIVFAMRILGIGWKGLNLFCGIMDLGSDISTILYYGCLHNICIATKAAYDIVLAKASEEEKQKQNAEHDKPSELTVSGEWTWSKRGFSSTYEIATIIGKYSKKVLDAEINLRFCEDCCAAKIYLSPERFSKWIKEHEEICPHNYLNKSENTDVNATMEIFFRSEEKHGVKYTTYIGEGNSKIVKTILEMKPYGNETIVTMKECVDHLRKRLHERLRNVRKNTQNITGKEVEKLKENVILYLTKYYDRAIENNSNSVQDMKNAIWATYYHASSSDENPQHQFCPLGRDSWCEWRKAEAEETLDKYKHGKPLLSADVQAIIKLIYEDFTEDDLLKRCLGANKRHNNERLHSLIWTFSPEHLYGDLLFLEFATYLAVCIFNEGFNPILRIMITMGIFIGQGTLSYVHGMDAKRMDSTINLTAQHDLWEEEKGALYNDETAKYE